LARQQQAGALALNQLERHDHRWQTRAATGCGLEHFTIDWDHRRVICPEGDTSSEWTPRVDNRGNDSIYIRN
jgi:hypothetical protein